MPGVGARAHPRARAVRSLPPILRPHLRKRKMVFGDSALGWPGARGSRCGPRASSSPGCSFSASSKMNSVWGQRSCVLLIWSASRSCTDTGSGWEPREAQTHPPARRALGRRDVCSRLPGWALQIQTKFKPNSNRILTAALRVGRRQVPATSFPGDSSAPRDLKAQWSAASLGQGKGLPALGNRPHSPTPSLPG